MCFISFDIQHETLKIYESVTLQFETITNEKGARESALPAFRNRLESGYLAHEAMRIENESLRSALIETFIALRRVFK